MYVDSAHDLLSQAMELEPDDDAAIEIDDDDEHGGAEPFSGEYGDHGEDFGPGEGEMGMKVCPHCTMLNEADNTDCEICGLPLS